MFIRRKYMKVLEQYFFSKGILEVDYGIAYNIEEINEVKYWDKNGEEVILKELPEGMETGIFCFKYQNGQIKAL